MEPVLEDPEAVPDQENSMPRSLSRSISRAKIREHANSVGRRVSSVGSRSLKAPVSAVSRAGRRVSRAAVSHSRAAISHFRKPVSITLFSLFLFAFMMKKCYFGRIYISYELRRT